MDVPPETDDACGWQSDLQTFNRVPAASIVERLNHFVRDAGPEQYRAWQQHVPALQAECRELAEQDAAAPTYGAILEYRLPYDLRRPDLIVLEQAAVVVTETKGRAGPTRAALDQVLAYARDLRAYHAHCADRPVIPVLMTAGAARPVTTLDGVLVCHPGDFDAVLAEIAARHPGQPPHPRDFVAPGAYVPLPTIVQAARQLFESRELPFIKRARAATTPALERITVLAHAAARDGTRHLVLLAGVPGSGKTLVGLQLVHSRWLDDLAEPRADGRRPSSAGVYLSGNGPLVRVLQDALADGGGGGQTFVRPIKAYVEQYSRRNAGAPPEHLLVFDEAQRAHDAEQVAYVQGGAPGASEPEHLLGFCTRVPRWSVLVALIGTGQAIHVGEEVGLPLWRDAIERVATAGDADARPWTVHCPPALAEHFAGAPCRLEVAPELSLDAELRFHLTRDVHCYVERLLDDVPSADAPMLADTLHAGGHRFFVTRELDLAKAYLRERYGDSPLARYGLVASSKDKLLPRFGVDNTFQTTKRLREGRWFNAPPGDPDSCCALATVATEFASQGLELDAALLAWGSDFRRAGGRWTDDRSGGYRRPVKDRLALRRNVYRVLLTRGRDGTIVYVPDAPDLDETFTHLRELGCRELGCREP